MLGRRHPLFKRVRALRRDPERRRAEGIVVAEGIRVVESAWTAGASIEIAIVSPRIDGSERGRRVRDRLASAGVPVERAAADVVEGVQDARGAQPLLALVRWRPEEGPGPERAARSNPLVLVTAGIQDPGNLGTLVRTADAVGVDWVVVTGASVDPSHPRAVRASAGSLFRLPVYRDRDPVGTIRSLRGNGLRLLAAGPRDGASFRDADWTGAVALVLGREGSGLPDDVEGAADASVTIPMRPGVESLSVGAAGALLLYEAIRQRG